jgi:hypothetical protein
VRPAQTAGDPVTDFLRRGTVHGDSTFVTSVESILELAVFKVHVHPCVLQSDDPAVHEECRHALQSGASLVDEELHLSGLFEVLGDPAFDLSRRVGEALDGADRPPAADFEPLRLALGLATRFLVGF